MKFKLSLCSAELTVLSVLAEHINTETKVVNFNAAHDPWPDSFAQHLVLVFSSEDFKLLAQILRCFELPAEIDLFLRDKL